VTGLADAVAVSHAIAQTAAAPPITISARTRIRPVFTVSSPRLVALVTISTYLSPGSSTVGDHSRRFDRSTITARHSPLSLCPVVDGERIGSGQFEANRDVADQQKVVLRRETRARSTAPSIHPIQLQRQ
jgi:hypothetical protein